MMYLPNPSDNIQIDDNIRIERLERAIDELTILEQSIDSFDQLIYAFGDPNRLIAFLEELVNLKMQEVESNKLELENINVLLQSFKEFIRLVDSGNFDLEILNPKFLEYRLALGLAMYNLGISVDFTPLYPFKGWY